MSDGRADADGERTSGANGDSAVRGESDDGLAEAEAILVHELGVGETLPDSRPIFILGAPRTGSTSLYKDVVSRFGFPYIANITNDCFARTPLVGLAVQKSRRVEVDFSSRFGKTPGAFQPSEGSGVFTCWFGGGQPSQTASRKILPGKQRHFLQTLAGCEKLHDGAPLVIKNAWNCFRVEYLANTLPGARFIWLQRDIVDAASSDLMARYLTKGTADAWNSATPANHEQLAKRPPAEQVVENQFEFNRAIAADLERFARGRWMHVWFEDYVNDGEAVMKGLAAFLQADPCRGGGTPGRSRPEGKKLGQSERREISEYARSRENAARLGSMFYRGG